MKFPLALFFLFATTLASLSQAPRPNIVLIMADDMGWGDPSYNSNTVTLADGVTPHPDQGWISTPVMDEMAAQGIRFDRFYSASAVCSPTRASCLTGRNPYRVGVPFANQGRMEFDETPLSEILAAEGYQCGHFGKWHLGSMTTLRADSNRGGNAAVYSAPWHHSYDYCFATESKVPTYHPYRTTSNSAALPASFTSSTFYGTRYWRMPASFNETSGEGIAVLPAEINNPTDGDDSKLIVDDAIPFIQQAVAAGEPFFVVLWFHTPHKPLTDPDGTSAVDSSDALKDSIEDMDVAIGRFRDELDALNVRGDTMLWLTSDNGPENGDDSPNESSTVRSIRSGRLLERKRSLHEGGLRVPGILEWPSQIAAPFATSVPAVTSDYYPTILDYLQLSVPNQKPIDGISLRPVIEGTAAARTTPIGFKINDDNSWVGDQYKLIEDNGIWELYDLVNIPAGQEPEQTPIATANNITTQSQATQDIYNTMLAEFTAWDATLAADTSYIHPAQPAVTLTTPLTTVEDPFTVTATFSKAVVNLELNEIIVSNGTAANLSGSGTTWTIDVTPGSPGIVEVQLPAGAANDSDGNPNISATPLEVAFAFMPFPPATGDPVSIISSLPITSYQTVDSLNNVPGDQDNNLLKFTAGNTNDGVANPFTTDLYVRASSSAALRRVQAHLLFDLSTLGGHPIRSARLEFNSHSLNDNAAENIDLLAEALSSDWLAPAATPTYNHPVVGSVANGGSLIAGLDANHTRDYEIDLTEAANNWTGGVWPNFGIRLSPSNPNANNGVGINLGGSGPVLIVEEAPLVLTDFYQGVSANDITLVWNSAPSVEYRVEISTDLSTGWSPLADVTGASGELTVYSHFGALDGTSQRFYRVTLP